MGKRVFAAGLLLAALLPAQSARAASGKLLLGLQGGVAFPSSASGSFSFGASALYRLGPKTAVGAFIQGWGASVETRTDSGSGSAGTSAMLYGGEFSAFLDKGLRLGGRIGVMGVSSRLSAEDDSGSVSFRDSESGFFVMPMIGYEHRLSGSFTIGAEIGYALSFSSQAPSLFNLMVGPRLWF